VLLRSIIVESYCQQETVNGFAAGSDDRSGRALDRLFDADRKRSSRSKPCTELRQSS
jgi:hypothetical protein